MLFCFCSLINLTSSQRKYLLSPRINTIAPGPEGSFSSNSDVCVHELDGSSQGLNFPPFYCHHVINSKSYFSIMQIIIVSIINCPVSRAQIFPYKKHSTCFVNRIEAASYSN